MNKANLFIILFLATLISGCDNKGGMDINDDGKPDGVRGSNNGYCPGYSRSERPERDGYCYPG